MKKLVDEFRFTHSHACLESVKSVAGAPQYDFSAISCSFYTQCEITNFFENNTGFFPFLKLFWEKIIKTCLKNPMTLFSHKNISYKANKTTINDHEL